MTQSEATELATRISCPTERQARTLEVIYRRSGVNERRTVLPHRIALTWLGDEAADRTGEVSSGKNPAVLQNRIDPAHARIEAGMGGEIAEATEETAARVCLGPTTNERMAFYEAHAGTLAEEAARRALAEADAEPHSITHLVTVTCTGFYAPGVDVHLIEQLGLSPTVQRVQVGFMGCHGAINGLRVAQGLAHAPDARVLLCAVELCSLHYRFTWDPERFIGNALFADGAAAALCDPAPAERLALRATGSRLLPDSTDAMTWRIGDHGFEMTLSARVPEIILTHLRTWLTAWLDAQGLALEDVRAWAVHPGGPRIVSAVEEALELTPDDTRVSRDVLAEHGNMSSPTVLFILDRLRRAGASGPCVALGFGPGLVAEVALFDLP